MFPIVITEAEAEAEAELERAIAPVANNNIESSAAESALARRQFLITLSYPRNINRDA
jgi:Rod binding domain-containing protein